MLIFVFLCLPLLYLGWRGLDALAKNLLRERYRREYAVLAFAVLAPLALIGLALLAVALLPFPKD